MLPRRWKLCANFPIVSSLWCFLCALWVPCWTLVKLKKQTKKAKTPVSDEENSFQLLLNLQFCQPPVEINTLLLLLKFNSNFTAWFSFLSLSSSFALTSHFSSCPADHQRFYLILLLKTNKLTCRFIEMHPDTAFFS